MVKRIQKSGLLIILLLLLSSCFSMPRKIALTPYDSSNEILRAQVLENINDDRMITYSVSLELSVKNTEDTRKMLIEQIKNNNGFVIRETENSIAARIPSKNMNSFINTSKTFGKVKNESKTGTDITDQYRDNVIRLDSLKNIRNRYLALLEKANSVNDILSIEKELERTNTEIEVLEGKIKYAELSVTYSNITVRFREKAKPGPIGWIFYGLYHGTKWLFVWN